MMHTIRLAIAFVAAFIMATAIGPCDAATGDLDGAATFLTSAHPAVASQRRRLAKTKPDAAVASVLAALNSDGIQGVKDMALGKIGDKIPGLDDAFSGAGGAATTSKVDGMEVKPFTTSSLASLTPAFATEWVKDAKAKLANLPVQLLTGGHALSEVVAEAGQTMRGATAGAEAFLKSDAAAAVLRMAVGEDTRVRDRIAAVPVTEMRKTVVDRLLAAIDGDATGDDGAEPLDDLIPDEMMDEIKDLGRDLGGIVQTVLQGSDGAGAAAGAAAGAGGIGRRLGVIPNQSNNDNDFNHAIFVTFGIGSADLVKFGFTRDGTNAKRTFEAAFGVSMLELTLVVPTCTGGGVRGSDGNAPEKCPPVYWVVGAGGLGLSFGAMHNNREDSESWNDEGLEANPCADDEQELADARRLAMLGNNVKVTTDFNLYRFVQKMRMAAENGCFGSALGKTAKGLGGGLLPGVTIGWTFNHHTMAGGGWGIGIETNKLQASFIKAHDKQLLAHGPTTSVAQLARVVPTGVSFLLGDHCADKAAYENDGVYDGAGIGMLAGFGITFDPFTDAVGKRHEQLAAGHRRLPAAAEEATEEAAAEPAAEAEAAAEPAAEVAPAAEEAEAPAAADYTGDGVSHEASFSIGWGYGLAFANFGNPAPVSIDMQAPLFHNALVCAAGADLPDDGTWEHVGGDAYCAANYPDSTADSANYTACNGDKHCVVRDSVCHSVFGSDAFAGASIVDVAMTSGFYQAEATRRRRALWSAAAAEEAAKQTLRLLLLYIRNGKLTADFCLGDQDDCDAGDTVRAVAATATVTVVTEPALGAALRVNATEVTLGAVGYLVAGGDDGLGEEVLQVLGPLGKVGVKRPAAELRLTTRAAVLKAQGAPSLGLANAGGCGGALLCLLDGVVSNNVTLATEATLYTSGDVELTAKFAMDPIVVQPGRIVLEDPDGLGPNLFQRLKIKDKKPKLAFGGSLGVKVCVEGCSDAFTDASRNLTFTAEAALEIGKTAALTLDARMFGWWHGALGIPMVHLGDLQAGIDIDVATWPPKPSALRLGGRACLGAKAVCDASAGRCALPAAGGRRRLQRGAVAIGRHLATLPVDEAGCNDAGGEWTGATTATANFIAGLAYVGYDSKDDSENFFLGMVTDFTMGKIFGVFGDTVDPIFHDWRAAMPAFLRETGVTPIREEPCTAVEVKDPAGHPDCFARVAIAPKSSQTVTLGGGKSIIVAKGYSLSGRVSALGVSFVVDAEISDSKFYVDAAMSPIDIGDGFVQIGRTLARMDEGPRFMVDFSATSQAVYVAGAFKIPLLDAAGATEVQLDANGFAFHGEGTVMNMAEASFDVAVRTAQHARGPGFYIAGAFLMNEGVGVASIITGAIKRLVEAAIDAAVEAMNSFIDDVNKFQDDANKEFDKVNDFCQVLPDGVAEDVCEAAVAVVIEPVRFVFNAALDIVEVVVGAIRDIPMAMLRAIVHVADAAAGALDAIISKIISVQKLAFALDVNSQNGGTIAAGFDLEATALGQKIDLAFDAEVGNVDAIAQEIFDKTLGPFVSFAEDAANAAGKELAKVGEAIGGELDKIKAAFEQLDNMSCGRGVGAPISYCPPNTVKIGALCYKRCSAGNGSRPGGWPMKCYRNSCPSGFTDEGITCHKPAALWPGDKRIKTQRKPQPTIKVKRKRCPKGYQGKWSFFDAGMRCWKKVKKRVCDRVCPAGYAKKWSFVDVGDRCWKKVCTTERRRCNIWESCCNNAWYHPGCRGFKSYQQCHDVKKNTHCRYRDEWEEKPFNNYEDYLADEKGSCPAGWGHDPFWGNADKCWKTTCPSGFHSTAPGVIPCVSGCEGLKGKGDLWHEDVARCWKHGREDDLGHALWCKPGEVLSGLLCYPPCNGATNAKMAEGEWHGVGPVCWSKLGDQAREKAEAQRRLKAVEERRRLEAVAREDGAERLRGTADAEDAEDGEGKDGSAPPTVLSSLGEVAREQGRVAQKAARAEERLRRDSARTAQAFEDAMRAAKPRSLRGKRA